MKDRITPPNGGGGGTVAHIGRIEQIYNKFLCPIQLSQIPDVE